MVALKKIAVSDMFAKWESRSLHVLGTVLFFVSLLLFPSLILAGVRGEDMAPFIWPVAIGLVLSVFLFLLFKNPKDMRPADGLLMMTILWFSMFAFGTLPFIMSGMSLVDAIFESVSGFTTCGATIMADVESWPLSLLLWRVMMHWIGGMIIVVMFMLIIPMVVSGGRGLLKNEMSGSGAGNLYVRLKDAAKQFIAVYIVLTTIFAVILCLMGVSAINSVSIAMSAISTGGFMNTNDSLDGFTWFVKIAVTVFMLLSATNFYLHFRAFIKKDFKGYRRSEEFKIMIAWVIGLSTLICFMMFLGGYWNDTGRSGFENAVDVFFTVASICSTTGFTTINYTTAWPFIGVSILIFMMFVGGSAGSTAGGIKVSRLIVVVKAMVDEIRKTIHPNAVYSVKYDGKGLDEDTVHGAMVVVVMFAITALLGTAVFDLVMPMEEALFATISMMSGTGPGMSEYFAGYSTLPWWTKLFSCIVMFLGRMEIAAALVLLLPGFWKELYGPRVFTDLRTRLFSLGKISGKNDPDATGEEGPFADGVDASGTVPESVTNDSDEHGSP